jgi:hypothetical protein
LICQALDGTVKEWRKDRAPIPLHIVEKGTVTLQIQRPTSEPVLLEIYSQSGMITLLEDLYSSFFLLVAFIPGLIAAQIVDHRGLQ